jgi:acetyltransferase-like isoleucine patch superfamily enzyme
MAYSVSFDDGNMGEKVKAKLRKCGQKVKIYPLAKMENAESIEVGDFSMIDDYTFINGGKSLVIGRYVHIASFVSVIGGGELIVGDYAVIAAGSRILTGTDSYYGGKRMSTALPLSQRNVLVGKVTINKDAFIGTNSVVHPNVVIGEGAVIGSNSLVLRDIEPWSINVGSPCCKIGERPRIIVEDI